jgi:hypothetical protein
VAEIAGCRRLTSSIPASQVWARFAAAARDEVDLEALNAALLGVVAETMQPEQVDLWLKSGPLSRR